MSEFYVCRVNTPLFGDIKPRWRASKGINFHRIEQLGSMIVQKSSILKGEDLVLERGATLAGEYSTLAEATAAAAVLNATEEVMST